MALASCASGKTGVTSTPSTAASPLTKEEFIRQANATCVELDKEYTQVASDSLERLGLDPFETSATQETMPRWAEFAKDITPIYEKLAGRLRALKPPKADEDSIDKALGDLDGYIAELNAAQLAAASGNLDEFNAHNDESGVLYNSAQDQLRAYGVDACLLSI